MGRQTLCRAPGGTGGLSHPSTYVTFVSPAWGPRAGRLVGFVHLSRPRGLGVLICVGEPLDRDRDQVHKRAAAADVWPRPDASTPGRISLNIAQNMATEAARTESTFTAGSSVYLMACLYVMYAHWVSDCFASRIALWS